MFPTFSIGPLELNTYVTCYAVALMLYGVFAFHRLQQLSRPVDAVTSGLFLVVLGALVGAFLLGVLPGLIDWVQGEPFVADRGHTFLGALLLGCTVAILRCRRRRIPLGKAFDLGILPLPLAQAIGRVGCLAAGCCYGKITDSPLGMHTRLADDPDVLRYPTQLIASVVNLLIFFVLLAVERYGLRRMEQARRVEAGDRRLWPFDGFIGLLYVGLYSLKRVGMVFLRGDNRLILFGGVNGMLLLSVAGLLLSVTLIAWNLRRSANPPGGYKEHFL